MKTQFVRFAMTAGLAVTALAAFAETAGSAHAAGDADSGGDVDGRDFLAWQRSSGPAASNKLFVGGLSYESQGATAQFNPKEIAIDKSVPWQ